MRIATAVLAVSMLGSSCLSGPCTAIGCLNSVTFTLTSTMQQAFVVNEGVTVKVCIGTDCQTGVLTNTGNGGSSSSTNPELSLNPGTGEVVRTFTTRLSGAQDVSIELTKNGNVVGADMRTGVTFTDFRPNGPACPPVCQGVKVTL